ncbi:hypothetical protein E8E95_04595 [Pseudomonas sp. BN414]|uniref:hypothetical protein n=1 Tax=Pseudomonas sp. BN414 TaxID=2567888 RepID=UPI0024541930|nr:hypothetical protein [Pseudomonas sp. BN414]MDH4565949.1 hypothetical protein [Pseudomonas sp. BN414]
MTRKYKGDLAKPIRLEPPGLLVTPEQQEAWLDAPLPELSRKMNLLLEEYGLEAGACTAAVWSLALDHVPGFQVVIGKGPGRETVWSPCTRALLVLSIEELQVLGITITEACKRLACEEPWASLVKHSNGGQVLRNESTRLDDEGRGWLSLHRDFRNCLMRAGEMPDEPGAFARKFRHLIDVQHRPKNRQ